MPSATTANSASCRKARGIEITIGVLEGIAAVLIKPPPGIARPLIRSGVVTARCLTRLADDQAHSGATVPDSRRVPALSRVGNRRRDASRGQHGPAGAAHSPA